MRRFTLLLLVFLLHQQEELHAQMLSGGNNTGGNSSIIPSDSSTKSQKKTDDSIRIYYTYHSDSTHIQPDRSIHNENNRPYLSLWHRDLGNFGTAYSSLLFLPTLKSGRDLGMQNKQAYLLEQGDCRYFNTTRPYTDIQYSMGTKQEQWISLLHTQNITSDWNLAMSYSKLVSPGQFKFLRSNHDQAMINTWYRSSNHRYELKAALLYNKLQQDENGGVMDETLLANPSFLDRRLIPVLFSVSNFSRNRSAVSNYYRQASFQFQHAYDFGRKETNTRNGSAFKLIHRFYSDLIFQYYKDMQPDSGNYKYLYAGVQANNDSLFDKHDLNRYGNTFSIQKEIRLGHSKAQLESGYGVETDQVNNRQRETNYLNQYIFTELLKLKEGIKPWRYQAKMKFYFTGNAAANLELHSSAGRTLPWHLGDLQLGFNQSVQSPSYRHAYYQEMISGNMTLKKMLTNKLSASYSYSKSKLSISANHYIISQYTYVDTNYLVQQYSSNISVEQFQLNKTFTWRQFNLENEIILQSVTAGSPLHVPYFMNHHKLYFSDSVFRKKLSLETGIGFTYNSPFRNDMYIPVFQSFAPQYNRVINNIPIGTAFINFGLRKFKAAIALDELQQLYAENNLNYPSFPRPNFMLRLRLNWVFIN